jgi:hypothetical protein
MGSLAGVCKYIDPFFSFSVNIGSFGMDEVSSSEFELLLAFKLLDVVDFSYTPEGSS